MSDFGKMKAKGGGVLTYHVDCLDIKQTLAGAEDDEVADFKEALMNRKGENATEVNDDQVLSADQV